MKRSKTLIFILSIIAVLAFICFIFPGDGLNIGRMSLRFPALSEMMGERDTLAADAPVEKPLRKQKAASEPAEGKDAGIDAARKAELAEQEQKFLSFIQEDPSSFSLPGGDVHFFDSFFEKLDKASAEPVRVIHYGDSQIEEDRITSRLRARLQERFGGMGPGMMPVRKYYTTSAGVSTSRELRRFMIFGDKSYRVSGDKYGPFASFVRMDTSANVVVTGSKNKAGISALFDKATLVVGNVRGSFKASGADSTYKLDSGNPIELLTFNLPDSSARVSLSLSGHADIYGVLLDGRSGVSVDNVAMRGCSGSVFTQMNQEQLRSFYEQAGVKMIMLQYGGNSVPYIKTEKAVSTYKESLGKQIELVKSLAPDATIVFIGPSDMSTSVGGKRVTYQMLPSLVDSLRAEANAKGAAYWSIYDAMGGNGSMASWVKANPALASSDYIHFTSRGAMKMGDLFADALMVYYDYYRWRKENE